MGWGSRLAWSGELPASEAVVLQRFDSVYGAGGDYAFAAAAGPDWEVENWDAATAEQREGQLGGFIGFNTSAPASEQTALRVPYFSGLWPSSGKLVLYAWGAFTFAMSYTPILSTRNTSGKAPLAYLSALSNGKPRHGVYSAAGALLLDEYENPPWTPTSGEWVCYAMCLDLDARTSQIGQVRRDGSWFVSPVRSFSGAPNVACEADLHALTLSPTASFWASGWGDEFAVLHEDASFDFAAFVEQVRLSTWARGGAIDEHVNLVVSDSGVTAAGADTLWTGAEAVSWTVRPDVVPYEPLTGEPLAWLSSDDGETWSGPTGPGDLPASFTGLVRWQVPMVQGEAFTGLELVEPVPVPVVDPLDSLVLVQGASQTVAVSGTWTGTPVVHVSGGAGLDVVVDGLDVTVSAGLASGDFTLTVWVVDSTGQASVPVAWLVSVEVAAYVPPDTPVFPRTPIILHGPDGDPEEVIVDPVSAVLLREVNGEQTLTFTLPAGHRHAGGLVAERAVTCAGDMYQIRRLTSYRDGGVAMVEVFCEAAWYDLRTAGRVAERVFNGALAVEVLGHVLDGTGWTVSAVTVTGRRSWTLEECTPLEGLRRVADVYGGDLVFDGSGASVSLLAESGRDRGVAFFRGRGLSDARRVEDTTSLLTRIEPRNEEGVGIESVNGGVPYVEDFSFTSAVRYGVYSFASGTSPQTMLSMTVAALGKRAKPTVSYEATIADLSAWSGQEVDRFDVGDVVLLVDEELGIETRQRIVALEYDLLQPWASRITLSEQLRSLGSDDSGAVDAGVLDTGATIDTRDLVPFNLLRNGRFDNGLAGWSSSGVAVVGEGVTGPNAAEFTGSGESWIEQTVATDTRAAYTLSLEVDSSGGSSGWVPDLRAEVEIVYEDGSTELVELELS